MASVLVTSGEERSALAAVRSLGEAGHEVVVCSESGRSLAGASRWARTDRALVSPLTDPDEFVQGVAALAEEFACDVVLPVTDPAVLAVLRQHENLPSDAAVPFPSLDTYRQLSDKREVVRAASRLGIAVPDQRVLTSPDAVAGGHLDDLRYPVVVKPARSVIVDSTGTLEKTAVAIAASPRRLGQILRSVTGEHFPVLLQEHIPGSGAGVFLLRWDGRTFARFAHRRLREKPPSGGVSVYRESIEPPSGLFEASERLLERFDWRGVAMVEYRIDARDGTPYLMEVNGRLWGSLQLAVDSGVDFPRLLVELTTGHDVEPVMTYRTGIRCRWEWGDIDHMLQRIKGGMWKGETPPVAEGGSAPSTFFIPWRPGDRYEVFRLTDPRPFARETRQWLEALLPDVGPAGDD